MKGTDQEGGSADQGAGITRRPQTDVRDGDQHFLADVVVVDDAVVVHVKRPKALQDRQVGQLCKERIR